MRMAIVRLGVFVLLVVSSPVVYPYQDGSGLSSRDAAMRPSTAAGSDLYRLKPRYYDAGLKRFVTADPIGLNGGPNLYAYCANNPILLIDVVGHCGVQLQPWTKEMIDLVNSAKAWNTTSPGGSWNNQCYQQATALANALNQSNPKYWNVSTMGGAKFGFSGSYWAWFKHNVVVVSPSLYGGGINQNAPFVLDGFKGSMMLGQNPNSQGTVIQMSVDAFKQNYPVDIYGE